MMEVTGIPLIGHCYYTFCIALLTYVPLVLCRIYLEEAAMSETIGEKFLDYKSEVNAFFPFKKAEKRL